MCILVKMVMLRPALYFLKSLPTFKALTVIADISCSQALYSCEAMHYQSCICFVEIVTTSQSIDELNYFPNCDTLQARQPFGNYSVLLYLYFTVIIFLIRLLCVTYRFRTTLTKNKQQFETHGFGCVSQQNSIECFVKIFSQFVLTDHMRRCFHCF